MNGRTKLSNKGDNSMNERETLYFEVLVYDYVSSIGGYRRTPLATRIFHDEEAAVAFARKTNNAKREVPLKIDIRQVIRIVNWQ
jgi:hypothetical protein